MNDRMIQVTVFFEGPDGIAREHRKLWRKAMRYQQMGERETCLVRVQGQLVWAERYPATVWTVTLR